MAGADPALPDAAFAPLAVEIIGAWPRHPGIERPIRAAIAALALDPRVAPFLPAEATVALSADGEVRALNRGWRGKDQPTNVLSFPTPPGTPTAPGIPPFVGDVVMALETVEREAGDLAVPFRHHVQHLVVHGLLHLFGFDHEEEAMAADMEAIETRILATIGVADPHAPDAQWASEGARKNPPDAQWASEGAGESPPDAQPASEGATKHTKPAARGVKRAPR